MTLHPVLPPLLLAAVAALLVAAQVVALRPWQASGRNRAALWRWLGVTSAALLLVVAATRVVIIADDEAATRSAGDAEPNVFLLVDRSPDMAVRDLDGRTRMEVARDDIEALIDRYPQARFAVIGFASAPVTGLAAVGGYLEPAAGAGHRHPLCVRPRRRRRRPTPVRRARCCATS